MGFHQPNAWIFAAAAVVVAVCYLCSFRRQRREFATLELWRQAIARRPVWYVARFWLSVAVQMAIALLLATTLADPYWKSAEASRRNFVLIVDVSASMSAVDLKPTRLGHAKAEGRRLIGSLRRGEEMAIVAAGSEVQPACRFASDADRLYETLAALRPTDGVSRIGEAVALARRLAAERKNSRIVVLSDGGFPDVEQISAADDIELVLFGDNGNNLGITQFELRASLTTPGRYEAFVSVDGHVQQETSCPLEFRLQDGSPQVKQLRFAAGSSRQESVFQLDVAQSGLAIAQLKIDDSLAADNDAFVLVPSGRPQPVVLVAQPGTRLESALAVVPHLDLTVTADSPVALPPGAVVVYDGVVPAKLPAGPILAIAPQNSCDAWDYLGLLRDQACTIRNARNESPLLSDVRINEVLVDEASRIRLNGPGEQIVASATGEPLYTAIERPAGRLLVLNIALEKSDLTLRDDFPILLRNAIGWLSPQPQTYRPAHTTSDVVRLPAAETIRRVASPTGTKVQLGSGPSVLALNQAGIWRVSDAGTDTDQSPAVILATNLANARETDLSRPAEIVSDELDESSSPQDQPLWMLFAGIVIVIVVAEFCLFHRRMIV